jgi:hypothetical protein
LLRRAQALVSRAIHEHILIYSCNRPPKQVCIVDPENWTTG